MFLLNFFKIAFFTLTVVIHVSIMGKDDLLPSDSLYGIDALIQLVSLLL